MLSCLASLLKIQYEWFFYYFRKCTLLIPSPPSTPSTTPTTTVTTTPATATPENCTVDCFDCPFGGETCQLVPGTRCSFKCSSRTPEICTNNCLDCGYSIGESCQLIPFTQCSFKCMRTPLEERCPNKCGFEMKCREFPGTVCQLVQVLDAMLHAWGHLHLQQRCQHV